MNDTFGTRNVAFNVEVAYRTPSGDTETTGVVYQGDPSDNAVTARRTVVLYDDPALTAPGATVTLDEANFYARDVAPSSPVYNVLEVRIVVWKM